MELFYIFIMVVAHDYMHQSKLVELTVHQKVIFLLYVSYTAVKRKTKMNNRIVITACRVSLLKKCGWRGCGGQQKAFVFFFLFFWFFKKFTFFYLFIYLFMTVLSLRFCARAFSSCGKWGPLLITVRRPLTTTASLVAEHRLQTRRLSNCGSRAQSLRGMWDPPRPGLEPVSPALAGRFSTTAPPGKPQGFCF